MSDKRPKPYMICYDITCPKRLGRLHRHLKKHAVPLQYSVFEAELTPSALNRLLREMEAIINARDDDVRVYPIQRNTPMATLGPAYLPDGLFRFGTEAPSRHGRTTAGTPDNGNDDDD